MRTLSLSLVSVLVVIIVGSLPAQEPSSGNGIMFDGLYYEKESRGWIGAIRFRRDGTVLLINKEYFYGQYGIPQDRGESGRYELAADGRTIRFVDGPIIYKEPKWDYVGTKCLVLEMVAPGEVKLTYQNIRYKPIETTYKTFVYRSDADVIKEYKRQTEEHYARLAAERKQAEEKRKIEQETALKQNEALRLEKAKKIEESAQKALPIVIAVAVAVVGIAALSVWLNMLKNGKGAAPEHATTPMRCRLCTVSESAITDRFISTDQFESMYINPPVKYTGPILQESAATTFATAALVLGILGSLAMLLAGEILTESGSSIRAVYFGAALIYLVAELYLFLCLYNSFNARFPFYREHIRRQKIAYVLWLKTPVGQEYLRIREAIDRAEAAARSKSSGSSSNSSYRTDSIPSYTSPPPPPPRQSEY